MIVDRTWAQQHVKLRLVHDFSFCDNGSSLGSTPYQVKTRTWFISSDSGPSLGLTPCQVKTHTFFFMIVDRAWAQLMSS